MKLTKTFNLKMYELDIKFIICPDMQAEFDRISKKKKENGKFNITFRGDAGGLAFSSSIHECYIILKDDSIAHSYIAHEILHTVEKITRDRGIKDEEARAYLCGHITKMIYQYLEKRKVEIYNG